MRFRKLTDFKEIVEKGHQAYDAKNYEEALKYYTQALDINSEDVDTWINLGLCHRHLERYDEAIECYMEATRLEPKSKLAWNNMGWAYHCKNDEQWARDAYKKALDLDPAYDRALVNLAESYNNEDNYEKTVEIFERALEIDPSDYNNWIDLGYAYRNLEEYDKSIEAYHQALKLNPMDKLALNNLGWAYYSIEELHMAVDCFKSALELDWRYDLPYKNLITAHNFAVDKKHQDYLLWKSFAKAFLIGRDYKRALSSCDLSLIIKPNYKSAIVLQEKIQAAKQKYEEIDTKKKIIEDTLDTFLTSSNTVLIKDIIDYVRFKSPDYSFKSVEIKAQIIDRIKEGRLNAKIDGKKIKFLD